MLPALTVKQLNSRRQAGDCSAIHSDYKPRKVSRVRGRRRLWSASVGVPSCQNADANTRQRSLAIYGHQLSMTTAVTHVRVHAELRRFFRRVDDERCAFFCDFGAVYIHTLRLTCLLT